MNVKSVNKGIKKVLVANRGEIALRIIRSLQETGYEAVAVYAQSDLDAPFVRCADEAYNLDGAGAGATYLDKEKILTMAKRAGADAIHPGYGFLSENSAFAQQVTEAGIAWIGPDASVIALLGDKIQARKSAIAAGIHPVPGTQTPVQGQDDLEQFVAQWGYPLALKASDGGGGRGIYVLKDSGDVESFFATWNSAGSEFFIERYIENARHIETQAARDKYGNFAVYSTRDCSVQRRHQKLIEEAPAPKISAAVAQKLFDASKALFEKNGYVGIGTCEFLLDQNDELYFLEVNPRLQVEHTITEEVSGIDLVHVQCLIAAGEALPETGDIRGHAIELRITSEDPYQDLMPSAGVLEQVAWPTGPGIRVDTGLEAGDKVSPEFDSLVAKLIVWAPNRTQAIKRALRALDETKITGIATPIPLYKYLLTRDQFVEGAGTRWLESGVLTDFAQQNPAPPSSPQPAASQEAEEEAPRQKIVVEIDGKRCEVVIPGNLFAPVATKKVAQPLRQSREPRRQESQAQDGAIVAQTSAIVVSVLVEEGDRVQAGDSLVVLEAMKMESYVRASRPGIVAAINVSVGEKVSPGQVLVVLEEEVDESENN